MPLINSHFSSGLHSIRGDRHKLEGELYAKIGPCEGVAEMHSYTVVQIDGEDDTTARLIQRNLLP